MTWWLVATRTASPSTRMTNPEPLAVTLPAWTLRKTVASLSFWIESGEASDRASDADGLVVRATTGSTTGAGGVTTGAGAMGAGAGDVEIAATGAAGAGAAAISRDVSGAGS